MVLQHAHPVDAERVARAQERGISAEDATRLSSLLSLLSDRCGTAPEWRSSSPRTGKHA